MTDLLELPDPRPRRPPSPLAVRAAASAVLLLTDLAQPGTAHATSAVEVLPLGRPTHHATPGVGSKARSSTCTC